MVSISHIVIFEVVAQIMSYRHEKINTEFPSVCMRVFDTGG